MACPLPSPPLLTAPPPPRLAAQRPELSSSVRHVVNLNDQATMAVFVGRLFGRVTSRVGAGSTVLRAHLDPKIVGKRKHARGLRIGFGLQSRVRLDGGPRL